MPRVNQMVQRGAWWKGITQDGFEVAVRHPVYVKCCAEQEGVLNPEWFMSAFPANARVDAGPGSLVRGYNSTKKKTMFVIRKLSERQLKTWHDYWALLEVIQHDVEVYLDREFKVPVDWT